MRTRSEEEVFKLAIDTYGKENQCVVAIEEMAELQKEICKDMRIRFGRPRNRMAEEIADCEIMIEQLKMIFKLDDSVEMYRLDKVVRLKTRLGMLDDELLE